MSSGVLDMRCGMTAGPILTGAVVCLLDAPLVHWSVSAEWVAPWQLAAASTAHAPISNRVVLLSR